MLSTFGLLCSIFLIHGALKKISGKMIIFLCYQGVNIFHQIFFSIDVVYTLHHRLISNYKLLICVISALSLLLYIILELFFMYCIIQLYQNLVETEIENSPQQHSMRRSTATRSARTHVIERTERNNPMQSSIIKLLEELEGNNDTSDTAALIK